MMVEQTNGHAGLGGDAAHGDTGMPVTDQATQRGSHQHFAALVRFGATVFRSGSGHRDVLGCGYSFASLVERLFNHQRRCTGF